MTRLAALLICAQLAAGCVQFTVPVRVYFAAPVQPPPGFLFTRIRVPLTVDFDETPGSQERAPQSRLESASSMGI